MTTGPGPVAHPTGYERPDRMWAALTDRIKSTAPTRVQQLQRRFLYDRFLDRVFTYAPEVWVLKGGIALLARVHDARHSSDVDLNRTTGQLDAAVRELVAAAVTDLDDHVRFTAELVVPLRLSSSSAKVRVTPYIGVRSLEPFKVDVVVGTVLTTDPDLHTPRPVVSMPGITSPVRRLYPVVDHIADKVCATMQSYGAGRPSSRSRDLVDLVVFACTHDVDSAELHRAIEAERRHRALPPIAGWSCPPQWAGAYTTAAAGVPHCDRHRTFAAANTLVSTFLNPVLAGQLGAARWSHHELQWEVPVVELG